MIEPLSQNFDMFVPAYPLPILEITSFVKSRLPDIDIKIISIPIDYGIPVTPEGKELVYGSLEKQIADDKARAVGISCTAIAQAQEVINLCERIKKIDPDIFIFLGGYFPTIYYEEIFRSTSSVDLIVTGEGEIPASMVIESLEKGKDPFDSTIPNLAWNKNGQIHTTESGIRFDLNLKAPIDRNLLNNPNEYEILPYAFSRGCPHHCSFCMEEFIRPVRKEVPPALVESDLKNFCEYGNIKTILITDALFKSFDYFRLFNKLDVKANFETRCDTIDPSHLPRISHSCGMIALGLESASYNTLRRMNKVRDEKHYRYYISNASKIFREAVKLNIPIMVFMIAGYPGDKREDLEQTLDFTKRLAEKTGKGGYVFKIGECRVYPKTAIYNYAKSNPDITFDDFGVFADNIVRNPSRDLDFEAVTSYMKTIFELSNFTKLLIERLTSIMPLFRMPVEAMKDSIIPDTCFKNKSRNILDLKRKGIASLKELLPVLHVKYRESLSRERASRNLNF